MHVDDSACNLSSINLLKFLREEDSPSPRKERGPGGEEAPRLVYDVEAYTHTVDIMITAQEIIVGHSGYPTPKIEANAHAMRQLGLGYANLGATLMTLGLPYDSPAGRAYAGALTAVMTGRAYSQSANVAARVGPFAAYPENREPMLRVIAKHRACAYDIDRSLIEDEGLAHAATAAWDEALELGEQYGYRNAQATVLAPTGTIAFMMDCDTTGVEPDIALVKYKKLVGGGMLRIVNHTVPVALRRLGYTETQVNEIVGWIDAEGTIEGAPHIKDPHLPVFDCAFRADKGVRSIDPMGHVLMMGAIQPFISGAISKTVNVPNEATVDDVFDTYVESWKQGVKAIAIYRDGSKAVQPLSTSNGAKTAEPEVKIVEIAKPVRKRLPDTRMSITHKFDIEGHEGYLTVGCYEDGSPGEVFVSIAKQGSTTAGLCEAFGRSISYALQYGVPLRDLVQRFSYMRFEPMGRTANREIPVAQSIVDYIFRWLASQFLDEEAKGELGILTETERARLAAKYEVVQPTLVEAPVQPLAQVYAQAAAPASIAPIEEQLTVIESVSVRYTGPRVQADAPACASCGWIMSRSGTCYRCENCGSTSGCS
jgi:ribonucleoside-diphosphate reductase alpha chain